MDIHFNSESSIRITRKLRQNLAHVGRDSGDTEQTGFIIQSMIEFVPVQALLPQQVNKHAWVDGAAAGAHHQTLKRRETHRGIDADAIMDRRHRRAVPQMGNNEPQVPSADHLCRSASAVSMAQSVKAVAAHSPLACPFLGDRIGSGRLGQGGMEGGVKRGYLWDLWQDLLHRFDAGQADRVVERRQLCEFRNHPLDLWGDPHGGGVPLAAVHDAMSNSLEFAVANLSPVGGAEISGNTSGRVANKGMEGLAITPDGGTLVGIMQSPLLQDGGTNGPITRIVTIDIKTGVTHEYGYEFDNIGTPAKPKYGTASEIVAINEHEFLVDERDGKDLGDGSMAVLKRLYHIDLNGAQEVSAITGAANLAGKAVVKVLFLDIVAELNHHDIASTNIPAKLEGVAFGQDIVVTGVTKHTLYVTNDNDFTATVGGVDNPNQFFVFAVDSADLPGFVPQKIKSINVCTP
jgi:Esterase-like activity of phytase